MENNHQPIDFWGIMLVSTLFLSLFYAGFLAYKSIDWDILKRLEAEPLILPTQAPVTIQTPIASPSSSQLSP